MEKALLDEGAVEQRFGLEVAGFECVLSGGRLLTAEAIEAPLNFGERRILPGFRPGGRWFGQRLRVSGSFGRREFWKERAFAFFGTGTGRELRVCLIGGMLVVRCHRV